GQYTTRSTLRRVQDQLAVGRNRRRLVEIALRQHLHLARSEVLDRQVEAAAFAAYEYESLAVGQMPRRNIVVAFEGHPFDAPAAKREPVDLRAAAAIRREQNRAAIPGKIGLGVDAPRGHDALHAAAIGVD